MVSDEILVSAEITVLPGRLVKAGRFVSIEIMVSPERLV